MWGRMLLIGSLSAVAGGCVTTFNKPISTATASASFAVAKCEKDGRLIAAAAPFAPARLLIESSEADFIQSQPSDLHLGIEIINSGTISTGRLKTLSTEFSNKLGFNLAQFQEQLLLVDEDGAAAAQGAASAKSPTSLLTLHDNAGANISLSDWQSFSQSLAEATATSGWTASFAKTLGATARAQLAGHPASEAEIDDLTKKYLLAAYMVAYFRNGQIFQLNFDDEGLKTKLMDQLKQRITDPQALAAAGAEIDAVNAEFERKLCGNATAKSTSCNILGVLGEQTFVTRAGKSYGFPGISATIDLTAAKKVATNKINTNDVIEDLIRVFFEAAGDSAFRVPGAANSTLCKARSDLCATAKNSAAAESADNVGDYTEAATTTVVSAAVRGGGLFSLNNEPVADSITTAAAVVARKIAEEAAFKKATGACDAGTQAHRNVAVTVVP